jgi:glycosyltransferase involved in cell wall biosynthesis
MGDVTLSPAGHAPADAMTERQPVTVVIAARDAGRHISDCVASVIGWAAEVLVVENDSADDTVERARAAGATVFSHPFRSIGAQRNVAIGRAANPWIFVLDHDERCTPELAREIAATIDGHAAESYKIRRRNYFLGREIKHGGWERDRPIRLFRWTLRYDERPVHEHVITTVPPVVMRERMLHYSYESLSQYFEKLERYSRWWADQQYARGRRAGPLALTIHTGARFVTMYFLKRGFLDGGHGLVLAVLTSIGVAAKYARLWALGRGIPR